MEVFETFLTDVIGLDISGAADLELINSELPPEYEEGKLYRLDIRVKTKTNEYIHVDTPQA